MADRGRVGLDDALRDGVLVGVDETCEVHVRVLSFSGESKCGTPPSIERRAGPRDAACAWQAV